LRGTPAELTEVLKQRSLKGEFVVIVAGREEQAAKRTADDRRESGTASGAMQSVR
jgi:16S rRNA C1402 (ribose-2'-O) methylase RsmI